MGDRALEGAAARLQLVDQRQGEFSHRRGVDQRPVCREHRRGELVARAMSRGLTARGAPRTLYDRVPG